MKQKKYQGLYEYYRSSDPDKAAIAYYINYRNSEGKPIKEKVNASTPEEAMIILAQKKELRNRESISTTDGTQKINKNETLKVYAENFFASRTTKNNRKDALRFKKYICNIKVKEEPEIIVDPYFSARKKLISIVKSNIIDFREMLQKKDLSCKTVNDILNLLTLVLNDAYENGDILNTPPKKIKKLSVNNTRTRVLTQEELNMLFNSAEEREKMFLFLMYYTCQRPQSILEIQKKHISNDVILIQAIKKSDPHKIPVTEKLAEELHEWIELLEPDDYVISLHRDPKKPLSYSRLNRIVAPLFKPLNEGLDAKDDSLEIASLYTLRHTSLTNVYQATNDIYLVQRLANHTSAAMTQRYAKGSTKQMSEGLNLGL